MEMCVSGILGVLCRSMEPPHGVTPCRWWSRPADVVLGPAADTARQPAGRGSFRRGTRPGAQLCCTDASPRSVRAPRRGGAPWCGVRHVPVHQLHCQGRAERYSS